MRVTICDDDKNYIDSIRNSIIRWKEDNKVEDIQIDTYYSSEDLWEDIQKHYVCDLIFLDIQIPHNMDGLTLAQLVREKDSFTDIVYITQSKQHVVEGYKTNALRYIEKPFSDAEIWEALSIVANKLKMRKEHTLLLNTSDRTLVVPLSSIVYIDTNKHYLDYLLANPERMVRCRQKMTDIIGSLENSTIIQISKGTAINIMYVTALSSNAVTLGNRYTFTMGQRYRERVRASIESYHFGK